MAEFCNQCLIAIELQSTRNWTPEQKAADPIVSWFSDPDNRKTFRGECADRVTEEDVKNGKYGVVLCESCDFTLVDHNGNCLTDCDFKHGTMILTGRPGRNA